MANHDPDNRSGVDRDDCRGRRRRWRSTPAPEPEQLAFDFGLSPTIVRLQQAPAVESAGSEAEFIPFPLAHRRPLVAKLIAEFKAASTAYAAENLLQGRLARLARGLRRRRISEQAIANEIAALKAAVRSVSCAPARKGDHSNG